MKYIDYALLEKIIVENLGLPATEIANLYVDKHPEILQYMSKDSVRRNIAWYIGYRKSSNRQYLTKPEKMILCVSDIHYGKVTYFANNPSKVDYNSEVSKDRLYTMIKSVKKIYSVLNKSYDIDTLYIFNLGDFIDGELTYPAQQINIDTPEFKQITNLADILGNIYDDLGKIFPKIEIYSVAGNHARNPKMHSINRGDIVLYEMLKREYKHSQNIMFNYSETFYQLVKIYNTTFLLYHGHSIRSYVGIPFYGIQQWGNRHLKSWGASWDFLIMGHFHIFDDLTFPSFKCKLNGTLVSSDPFTLEYFGSGGDNRFHLFGVHPERGITFKYEIYVNET